MSVSITRSWIQEWNPEARMLRLTVAFDSSYPTGGEAVNLSDYLSEIVFAAASPKDGYVFEIDETAFAAGTLGLKVLHVDMDAMADSPLVEVDDESDLDALTGVSVLVIGR
jgi:hypothetical protein